MDPGFLRYRPSRVVGHVARFPRGALLRRMRLRRIVRTVFVLVSPVGMAAVASAPAAPMTSAAEIHEDESADQQDPKPVRAEVSEHHVLPFIVLCVFQAGRGRWSSGACLMRIRCAWSVKSLGVV